MSRLSQLAIRRNNNSNAIVQTNSNAIVQNNSNAIVQRNSNSSLPSMLGQNMQLMSGVRKGNNYYIAIHGNSFNEIKKSFKIPIEIMEQFYNNGETEDVNAVIAFALESLVMQMRGSF